LINDTIVAAILSPSSSFFLSALGHSCAQLATNGSGYIHFYPTKAKSEEPDTLMDFIHESGVPAWLVVDNALEQNYARWNKIQREFHILQTNMEPYSPWQNRAESEIRELQKLALIFIAIFFKPKYNWSDQQWCHIAWDSFEMVARRTQTK
jgi:hypothetical protein